MEVRIGKSISANIRIRIFRVDTSNAYISVSILHDKDPTLKYESQMFVHAPNFIHFSCKL